MLFFKRLIEDQCATVFTLCCGSLLWYGQYTTRIFKSPGTSVINVDHHFEELVYGFRLDFIDITVTSLHTWSTVRCLPQLENNLVSPIYTRFSIRLYNLQIVPVALIPQNFWQIFLLCFLYMEIIYAIIQSPVISSLSNKHLSTLHSYYMPILFNYS